MDFRLWMWCICSTLALVSVCNCASRHVPVPITKCEFYNRTLCGSSHGLNGCGNVTQECTPAENDKPSSCFAVWTNNTKTNELTVELKVIIH